MHPWKHCCSHCQSDRVWDDIQTRLVQTYGAQAHSYHVSYAGCARVQVSELDHPSPAWKQARALAVQWWEEAQEHVSTTVSVGSKLTFLCCAPYSHAWHWHGPCHCNAARLSAHCDATSANSDLSCVRCAIVCAIQGSGFFALQSCANHSCLPNAAVRHLPDGSISVYALRPVETGEELTLNYLDESDQPLTYNERKVRE